MKSLIKVNGVNVSKDTIHFSAGEVQLVIPEDLIKKDNFVEAEIHCSDGLMLLLQLASLLKNHKKVLHLGYLPYSRYDRVEKINDPLSIKVFCNLINSMGFDTVFIEDCHSDVGLALIDNPVNIPQHELAQSIVPNIGGYCAIIAPDEGSVKKAEKLAKELGVPVIKCKKVRDFKTGKILSFHVPVEELNSLIEVLIVDDICDGGGTFIGLAEVLHKYVPVIDLYVTHGIFSKGVDGLVDAGISNIFAFNSWINSDKVLGFSNPEGE